MSSLSNSHLDDDASDADINDWLDEDTDQDFELVEQQAKKRNSAAERGRVRRSIEEIKERNRLRELLGDDYDYLDS